MKLFYILLFFFLSLHCSGQVFGQQTKYSSGDSNVRQDRQSEAQQTECIQKLYYQLVATPKDIINGKESLPYSFRHETTPYFHSRDKLNATLNANHRIYNNIKLQYDTYTDELIYTDISRILFNEFPRIELNKDIIDGFSLFIDGDTINFRHFRFPENQGKKLEDGFYEVVYEGRTIFIIRHHSLLYNKQGLDEYKYSPRKYVFEGDKYYKISNRKSMVLMAGDHSKEIKEFLHKSRIKVRRAGKDQIVEVLKYYDSLKETGRLQK
jgi:hypothetical protein